MHAVRGISLDVEPGELVAVLGPNGAGKTTTMRMLTTLIAPTSGTATVAGHDVVDRARPGPAADRLRRAGQRRRRTPSASRDELDTQGAIYGLDRRAARRRAGELLEALDLDRARRPQGRRDLSGGQRRRLDVAMGLVHAPSLLFLDEPSTGLDPQNRANLWEHILRMRAEHGMTIVLTTHYLDEADSMAERVVVVDHGEVIADDTAEALKAKLAGDRVVATAATPAAPVALAPHRRGAARRPRRRTSTARRSAARVDGRARRRCPSCVRPRCAAGVAVASAQVHRPTLDDVFLSLTGRSLREDERRRRHRGPRRHRDRKDAA